MKKKLCGTIKGENRKLESKIGQEQVLEGWFGWENILSYWNEDFRNEKTNYSGIIVKNQNLRNLKV